jgi:hypothetical protein
MASENPLSHGRIDPIPIDPNSTAMVPPLNKSNTLRAREGQCGLGDVPWFSVIC